jgi:integrase/recombinase XerC
MREAAAAFLRHLERERNASPHTIRAYAEDLSQLSVYLQRELGRAARPADVDHLLLRGFLAELHQRGLSKASSARKLAGLRSFFRYLCREGRLAANPARALATPRLDRRIPSVLDEAQAASILDMPGDGTAAVRGRAILELLYATGIRCAEAMALDVHEVDLGARMVRVLGKGRKERVVLFGRRAAGQP